MSQEERKRKLKNFLKDKFNLEDDSASQAEVVENIRKGVEFRGTNLWVLIFATFIASLGLNLNSTAVIIGAMLISPLMGPIMGIGLSIGTNDFDLFKRSVKNFGFMGLVSILASTLYFMLSPISTAQSELLARTTPTIYDVMIAFFGGLAGIVAQSRKDRTSTVIPGVAIATALMPPLCTAGYGIATGQFNFFLGAFYLFLINTVFIAFATLVVVRFLRYDKKEFLDKEREKRVKHYMAFILFATVIPSVIIGFRLVQESIFVTNADKYIAQVVRFERSQLIDHHKRYNRKGCEIELVMYGEPLSEDAVDNLRAQLGAYDLKNTTLTVRQPAATEHIDYSTLQQNMDQLLQEKNKRIAELETQVNRYVIDTLPAFAISGELRAIMPQIDRITVSKSVSYDASGKTDTLLLCNFALMEDYQMEDKEGQMIENWLKTRTGMDRIRIFYE